MAVTLDKAKFSEADIITKFILPSLNKAGWDFMSQLRQEVKLRDGKVVVRGQVGMRKTVKSADIVLYHKPNMPLAVIEAKANQHEVAKVNELMAICDQLKNSLQQAQETQILLTDAVVKNAL